ncbi:MAG: prolyl aminopeptidase [Ectothiorhodospiraceae bacterium]|nr:prolyl aminopeptidase [Ectothiorhodospiraceae bacterium]
MRDLYPKIKPYATHSMDVGAEHKLYVEECGDPDGIPVVFVHGGPGAGCSPYHRCFFNPEKYRIILFDQRGCGHSTPHASLMENTTPLLVDDMETIREKLGINQWLLFGGSWGSTLSLVYAETHPERTLGLILRGIFLCRPHEIKWFYQEGASHIFPDYWESFLKPIPENERDDMVAAYYQRLTSPNEIQRMSAAKAWSTWEGRTSTLHPSKTVVDHFAKPHNALSLARIECHYFTHDSFLEPNQILRDVDRLSEIPGVIVQGRYDVVCPMQSAWDLYQVWPNAEIQIIPDAGHSALETGIIDALVRATDNFVQRLM